MMRASLGCGRVFLKNPVVVFCIFMVYYTEEEVGKNERWSPMRSIEEISKTNPEKPLLVQVDGRCPLPSTPTRSKWGKTYQDLMTQYVKPYFEEGDVVYISEKIVSLCQRDIIPKESVKLSPAVAKFLARFASTNDSAGIGVHNVYKMQVAIMLCGKPKVLYAALAAGVGRISASGACFMRSPAPRWRAWTACTSTYFENYKNFGILSPKEPDKACNAKVEEETGVALLHRRSSTTLAERCWRCPPKPPWTSPCCKSC